MVAALILGSLAIASSTNMLMQPPNRDLWQHAAALRTLINDLESPNNPFVTTNEGSRHFSPWWVGWAAAAQWLNLSEWDVLRFSAYCSMGILASGIFLFSRAYYPSPWAPLFLLTIMLFGWFVPIQHTGFHSMGTLIYGAPYPATLLIGVSLLLWAITIHSLNASFLTVLLLPTAAFMFATHQLGAVIGFVGAGCFVLFVPNKSFINRLVVILGLSGGLAISAAWPYYNPLMLILKPGNSNWTGGPDFYSTAYLVAALVPSLVGVLGYRGAASQPLRVALVAYVCLYLTGLAGVQLAGRFLMPITLVLHIGLTSYLLRIVFEKDDASRRKMLALVLISFTVILMQLLILVQFNEIKTKRVPLRESVYEAALKLTRDIPDSQQVAALDIAAWPIVAVGQKVLSIPWPEPLIHDLATRQASNSLLFSVQHSKKERIQLAREAGIESLIVDKRQISQKMLNVLSQHSESTFTVGPMIRFDLVVRKKKSRPYIAVKASK